MRRRRGPLELPLASSLGDPAPLEAQVRKRLSQDGLVQALADAAGERTLLVGAVNMRTGFIEAFDLTAQAATPGDPVPCLTEALLASAAIPVAFPPRRLNGELYIDGAARQGLFLRALARLDVRPRIYMLVNNPAGFPAETPDYRLAPLASRASRILSDELLRNSAAEALRFARAQGWEVRGLFAPDVRPGTDCEGSADRAGFCESFTRQLFAAGYLIGRFGEIGWLDADEMLERLQSRTSVTGGAG